MKVRRVDITPHVRTAVFRLHTENYRFPTKLLYAVAYVPPLAHTRVRGGSLPLSEGSPSWRPSARLTTERYVKDQVPQLPAKRLNCIKSALGLTSAILGLMILDRPLMRAILGRVLADAILARD